MMLTILKMLNFFLHLLVVGGEVDGNSRRRCSLFSVSICIFSDEVQTKWNLTIIVFGLFKEKKERLEPSGNVR